MIKILANDGIHPDGELLLSEAGFEVNTTKIPQEDLPAELPKYQVICVRSATKVRKDLIDQCPDLKVIARGGVGLDNIDVEYARSKGIHVINTPAASSKSVAELVFAHLFTLARSLHLSNREMPQRGTTEFKKLKKSYSKGFELRGKTIGIIGFGRIGQETARVALGMGMKVLAVDPYKKEEYVPIELYAGEHTSFSINVRIVKLENMLANADAISLHVPSLDKPAIGQEEISMMKDGVILINAARGGVVDEKALLEGIESGKIAGAGLDVFVGEPSPMAELLNHEKISVSPHTGASTKEAQRNIGLELAEKILEIYEK